MFHLDAAGKPSQFFPNGYLVKIKDANVGITHGPLCSIASVLDPPLPVLKECMQVLGWNLELCACIRANLPFNCRRVRFG